MEDPDQAIRLARQQIDALPPDCPERIIYLNEVATSLAQGYNRTQRIEDLQEAIIMFREAVSATALDDPDREASLNNLGRALGSYYTATHELSDLDETIHVLRQELQVSPQDASTRSICMNSLGMRLGQRYGHTRAAEDLDKAISMSRAAVQATSLSNPDRAGRLHNLGTSLLQRYELSKKAVDLNDAFTYSREAVDIGPSGDPQRAYRFTTLGDIMTDKYALTRKDADLEEAIQMLRKGLQASPNNSAQLPVLLNNLALRLAQKYANSGRMTDLEEAIEIARRSVECTSISDPERINRQMSLANRLCIKHQDTGAIDVLDQGIAILEHVVSETSSDSSERANRLNNLGQAYAQKYLRTDDRATLDRAIRTLREAVSASLPGKPGRGASLSNLGNLLYHLYEHTQYSEHLEESLSSSQQAVDATPEGHPAMAERLCNVSLRRRDKFMITKNTADLNEAVRISQEALEVAPENHPIRSACLRTSGIMFQAKHAESRMPEDWRKARDFFTEASSVSNAAISERIKAGRRFLTLRNIGDDPGAYEVAKSIVDLIPQLTPRSLQNTDKQHLLSDAVGIASDAAAVALQSGKGAEAAIACLETGRGVIASASFEQHDVSRLMREHQDLGNSFVALRDRLDKPAMQDAGSSINPEAENMDPKAVADAENHARHEAQRELSTLLQEIRSLEGFDRFLLPASAPEMRNAARYGPIVILNVSSHRCDALLIEESVTPGRSVPLERVSRDVIMKHAWQFGSDGTLKWLWDDIVSPVLVALGLTTDGPKLASDSEWRHVWWIPTGHLTQFPLHAAGDHIRCDGNTTLDRVVSSYSASVRTIIHGRRQHYHLLQKDAYPQMDLVAVSMRETTGQTSLRHADREVEEVLSILDASILQPRRPQQYKKDVLSALDNCKIFHFAGHGSTHPTDPLQSKLLLKDWQQEPLTVASLLQAELGAKLPFLAYLSACGTSQIRSDDSVDESIHLANACQLAGFRHVVGTLWQVEDGFSVQIARLTYEFMRSHGIRDESVSRGLHHAIRSHRDQWVNEICTRSSNDRAMQELEVDTREVVFDDERHRLSQPLYWVPYVHFGV